jgi:hypothetical protein
MLKLDMCRLSYVKKQAFQSRTHIIPKRNIENLPFCNTSFKQIKLSLLKIPGLSVLVYLIPVEIAAIHHHIHPNGQGLHKRQGAAQVEKTIRGVAKSVGDHCPGEHDGFAFDLGLGQVSLWAITNRSASVICRLSIIIRVFTSTSRVQRPRNSILGRWVS